MPTAFQQRPQLSLPEVKDGRRQRRDPSQGEEGVGSAPGAMSTANHSCSNRVCRGCYGEIAEIVSATNGTYNLQTTGLGTVGLLKNIWRCMGALVENLLVSKHSCIFPNFFHASIKVQKILFWDRMRTFYKPQFVLLPDFTQRFHVRNVLVMPDVHYHATVAYYLCYQQIGTAAGTDRFTVEAALRDSAREIGKYLTRNPGQTLTIDIGVANLEFCGRSYRIKWSPKFLARLQESVGPEAVVSPYDPPSRTLGGPNAPCRFDRGCTSSQLLKEQTRECIEAEMRISSVKMNNADGSCGYRKTSW